MRRQGDGFTLIELVVTLAVLAILITLAAPSLGAYLQNQKLRGAAESILSGIQLARSEAVKRNATVDFVFTNANSVGVANVAATAAANGTNWLVRAGTAGNLTYIEGKLGVEGSSATADGTTTIAVSSGGLAFLRFNGWGQMISQTTPVLVQITNPAGGACTSAGGPMRCLNVLVSPGGQIKLCDPAITSAQFSAGDSRACR